jgi:hypothetical protein
MTRQSRPLGAEQDIGLVQQPRLLAAPGLQGRVMTTVCAGSGGHGECLRRTCGDAAGTQSGSSFVERVTVNTEPPGRGSLGIRRPVGWWG